jgi:preprotein translocase subunit SecB
MVKPPLQLNNYFFPVVSVVANPNWTPDAAAGKGAPLSNCAIKSNKIENSENLYEITISIEIIDTPENPSQYNVSLVAVGILTADNDLPNKDQNMAITGASILYSASREFLLQLLSRGPFPPIMLSPMVFNTTPPQTPEVKSIAKKTQKISAKTKDRG